MGGVSIKIRHMAKIRFTQRLPRKLCTLIIRLLLLSGLAALTILASGATASPQAVKWARVNIPTEGTAGNWVLATGSDIRHLTMAPDGTLYACAQGSTARLLRSTDGGLNWAYLGDVQDNVVDIAVSPHNANIIYYATSATVYRSDNGGRTFAPLPADPGGAGADHREITSIDVSWQDNHVVAVGTRDTDISEFGGVYTLDEADIIPAWVDTNIGSYDVYAVAFSPDATSHRQLVAVITDETDAFIAAKDGEADWNAITGCARLNKDNSGTPTPVAAAAPALIAFPDNYSADPASGSCFLFTAINTGAGEGDVYKIDFFNAPGASTSTDLNIARAFGQSNIDVTGLSVRGDYPSVTLLAGVADSTRTYVSTDGGTTWTRSHQDPTGQSTTGVLLVPDFITSGRMYAATSGEGSAFSISRDSGDTWNQLSLIDTAVDTIVALAPSPHYTEDNTLFMLTFGGGHSLWRSQDGGNAWERILASDKNGVDSLSLVGLPPQYGNDCRTIFVAGLSNGNPAIWQSTDDGQSYRRRFTHDPTTGNPFPVDTWAIAGETTLFIGSYDGSHGRVYQTNNVGFSYSEGAVAGSQSLNSLALSPDYDRDGTILAGNTNGWVYSSSDKGASFQPLPGDATSPPLTGSITIALDPEFKTNHTVYATSDATSGGIHRFILGSSTDWESIDADMPAGTMFTGLAIVPDGALYAANSAEDGGMERCLNPTFSPGPAFETVTRGLADGATLYGLWRSGHQLWSVDTANIRLMTFRDTLTSPVVQVYPDDGASGIGSLIDHTVRNISLDWETLDGATSYEWQCDYDTDFSSVPDGFEDSTAGSSTRLPALEPATAYYWRVRASTPVTGPWSEKWSFTTTLGTETNALQPESPAAGASDVPARPLFEWTAVMGADAYELLVATSANFSSPAVVRTDEYALPTNAWQCDVSLDYDTTYYWKVRAISTSTRSPWSAAGVFTTESPPEDTEPQANAEVPIPPYPKETPPETNPSLTATPLPNPMSAVPRNQPSVATAPQDGISLPVLSQPPGEPAWVFYLVGTLLLAIILALIIILAMVLKIKRF